MYNMIVWFGANFIRLDSLFSVEYELATCMAMLPAAYSGNGMELACAGLL